MRYLTPQDILVVHSEVIDVTGGSHGIRDIGLLISATERPKSSFGGKELYKSIFEKAAAYLESLASHHVFVDGNKRTAITVSARFLFLNGFELKVSNKELEYFVLRVVVSKLDIAAIAKWLKGNSRKKQLSKKQHA